MEDGRTTVMIKHIPNKFNKELFLKTINENHSSTYDFFYLPMDYKVITHILKKLIFFIE